ncbi:ribonuclease HII, partial [Shewanella sp. 11B5]
SIIAKVTRDAEMDTLDSQYPQYGFAKHKGYPTKAHFEALALYGVLPEHRKSFKPVADRILLQNTF